MYWKVDAYQLTGQEKVTSTRLPRRGLLQTMGGVAAIAAWSPRPEKILSFYHLHTHEKGKFRFWRGEDHDNAGLAEIDYLLREFRTGDIKRIDHRLLHLLYALRSDLDSNGQFEVISGYRSPTTNAELIVKPRCFDGQLAYGGHGNQCWPARPGHRAAAPYHQIPLGRRGRLLPKL